jgi:predicted nucleic acid-binding Zn ribbon protein
MARRGTTEALGDIVASLLQRRGYARPLALSSLREAWLRAAGERLASRSRVLALRDGVLTIEVASSAQCYELEAFRARQLLGALQADQEAPGIRRLVFRVGNPPS